MLEREWAIKLVRELIKRTRSQREKFREKGYQLTKEDARDLTIYLDITDYFIWLVLKCWSKEQARQLVELYSELMDLALKDDDHFHAGFFFALRNLLARKMQISEARGGKHFRDYDDLQQSFKLTLRYLDLEEPEQLE